MHRVRKDAVQLLAEQDALEEQANSDNKEKNPAVLPPDRAGGTTGN
jgi:hypothetical protein